MDARWQIQLLGELSYECEMVRGKRFSKRKTEALLAYLALLPGRTFAREALAAQFWPDTRDEAHSLRMALSELRKVLGSALLTDNRTVSLDPQWVQTDVGRFEAALRVGRWEEAVSLYSGLFLPGYYEDWVVAQQVRLTDLFGLAASRWVEEAPSPAEARARLATALSRAPEHPDLLALQERLRATPASAPPPVRASLSASLPLKLTVFVGRNTERARLHDWLSPQSGVRLVTLTGPPGSGKTRLAIELCRQYSAHYPQALWFVSLRELTAPGQLMEALRRGLELTESATTPPLEAIVAALGHPPHALLVLDNAEHLSAAVGELCRQLLTRLPQLTCLVTSRRRLEQEGERELPLLPLGREEALALFEDRARLVRPDFSLSINSRPPVEELCRRLDHLPLALELAAPRLAILSPEQLLSRIDAMLDFYSQRQPELHHRSLRAAIQSSYDLLPAPLQDLFAQLSVLRSGWTVADAEAILRSATVLEGLEELQRQSLLTCVSATDAPVMRFGLLETLQAFAAEQLAPERCRQLQQRHAEHFYRQGTLAQPFFDNAPPGLRNQWIGAEDNFQRALEQLRETAPEQALELATELAPWWLGRGFLTEGVYQLDLCLQTAPQAPPLRRGAALVGRSVLAEELGALTQAQGHLEEALALLRPLPESPYLGWALHSLGNTLIRLAEYERAAVFCEEARALWQRLGHQTGVGAALHNLAQIARHRGELDTAADRAQEALRLLTGWWHWMARVTLGSIQTRQGRYHEAQFHLSEALTYYRQSGSPSRSAHVLRYRAQASLHAGKLDAALLDAQEAEALYARHGSTRGVMLTRLLQAELALYQRRPEQAAHLLATCQLPATSADDADLLLVAGQVEHALADPSAPKTLQRALQLFQKNALQLGALEALEALAQTQPSLGLAWLAAAQRERQRLGAPRPRAAAPLPPLPSAPTWEHAVFEALTLVL